jgi:hypothetical protein
MLRVMTRIVAFGIVILTACAPVEMHSQIDHPAGEILYASTGDIVLRVNRADDLPNLFGRADLFGRTRDRGFSEVRFMGLNEAGMPIFRRRDVDIATNETTMSRTGGFGSFQAQGTASQIGDIGASQFSAKGASYTAPIANVGPLPPDTVEFPSRPETGPCRDGWAQWHRGDRRYVDRH